MNHWFRKENLVDNLSEVFTSKPIKCSAYLHYAVNFSWQNLTQESSFFVDFCSDIEHENGQWIETKQVYIHGVNGVNYCEGFVNGYWIRLRSNNISCILNAQLILKN